jgi:transcription antitermination factor NusG
MPLEAPMSRWYAVQVHLKHEATVAHHLADLCVEQYLPTISPMRSAHHRHRETGLPLFPGYVFARLDLSRGPRLHTIPGVVSILGLHGKPTPLEDDDVAAIRLILQSSLRVKQSCCFRSGDAVFVCEGPLSGVRGTFLHSTNGGTLVVSLPLLQRSLEVRFPSEWVTPAF